MIDSYREKCVYCVTHTKPQGQSVIKDRKKLVIQTRNLEALKKHKGSASSVWVIILTLTALYSDKNALNGPFLYVSQQDVNHVTLESS